MPSGSKSGGAHLVASEERQRAAFAADAEKDLNSLGSSSVHGLCSFSSIINAFKSANGALLMLFYTEYVHPNERFYGGT